MTETASSPTHAPTLEQAVIRSRRSGAEAEMMRGVARQGLGGAGSAYPYAGRIREAFGLYAPPRLSASIGGRAATASRDLMAEGYAFGNRVAFARRPSLFVAAHEAAHVAAAGLGARVPDGVGHHADGQERMANAAAQAVVRGRSAAPVFASAFAETAPAPVAPGAEQLQMFNRITAHTPNAKVDTPWKQIDDQLDLDSSFNLRSAISSIAGGYKTMILTMGDSAYRAETVTAELDGIRKGGVRTSDPLQTAYGNIGNFMSFITATPQSEGFEGGHLISDEILGSDSYVGYNFAPQRSSLNAPHYRKIEMIAAGGAKNTTTGHKAPLVNYKVTLAYDNGLKAFTCPTATVMTQLGIPPYKLKSPPPPTLNFNAWVPHLWMAEVEAGNTGTEKLVAESTVDTSGTTGASKGFLPNEASVSGKAVTPFGVLPDTLKYFDTTFWSMDTMTKASFMGPSYRSTGGALSLESRHTWTGVQSPPRGQTAHNPGGVAVFPPAATVAPPKLSKGISFSTGYADPTFKTISALGKRRDRTAGRIVKECPVSFTKGSVSNALHGLFQARQETTGGSIKRSAISDKAVKRAKRAKGKREAEAAVTFVLANLTPQSMAQVDMTQ